MNKETPEFDGIACNDGGRTSTTVSKRSFYQAQTTISDS